MSFIRSKQRFCHGAWILAALILAGVNGAQFLALQGHALEGYSPAIKTLQTNLNRLQHASKVQEMVDFSDDKIQHLLEVFRPKQPPVAETNTGTKDVDTTLAEEIKPQLPELSGIVQITDSSGKRSYVALLGGKVCHRGDRVKEFRVTQVSSGGVTLRRSGERWFIPRPEIYYSSDQGD